MIKNACIVIFFLQAPWAHAQVELDPLTRHRVEEVVSVFENSSVTLQYGYIEALGDGRGYTAGRMGATTGTGDLLLTVQAYLKLKPNSEFQKLLPILIERAQTQSPSIEGLRSLPRIWKSAARDPEFRKVQDDLENTMIYLPARGIAEREKVKTHLGFLCLYDAIIQHGLEGVENILLTLHSQYGSEADWMTDFLERRLEALYFPENPATQEEWRESRGRVFALMKLQGARNFDLKGPFQISPFGRRFTIR